VLRLSPEAVWWERVDRAAKRKGKAGAKLKADWVRDLLPVVSPCAAELAQYEKLEPAAIAERFTDEYIARDTDRLADELGVALGVGPSPGPPGRWLALRPERMAERADPHANTFGRE